MRSCMNAQPINRRNDFAILILTVCIFALCIIAFLIIALIPVELKLSV